MLKMTSHILFMCTRVRNCGYLTSQTFYLSVEIHLFFYPLILPPSYIIADLDLRINTVRNFVCNRFWTQLTKCSTVWLSSVFKAERAIGKVLQTYQRRSPGFCALFHTVRVARNFSCHRIAKCSLVITGLLFCCPVSHPQALRLLTHPLPHSKHGGRIFVCQNRKADNR